MGRHATAHWLGSEPDFALPASFGPPCNLAQCDDASARHPVRRLAPGHHHGSQIADSPICRTSPCLCSHRLPHLSVHRTTGCQPSVNLVAMLSVRNRIPTPHGASFPISAWYSGGPHGSRLSLSSRSA
jgi:hypothetical protein